MGSHRKRRAVEVTADTMWIDWSSIGPASLPARFYFLRIVPGFTYTVRLFHRPYRFWRQIGADGTSRIITAEAARQRAEGTVPAPLCRYAINVIDRADGQVKVLEGPERLFVEFRRCYEATGVDPGGSDGFDLTIQAAGAGAATAYRISYDVRCRTPFTADEKALLRERRFDLSTLFIAH